jgi:hypothetical protein
MHTPTPPTQTLKVTLFDYLDVLLQRVENTDITYCEDTNNGKAYPKSWADYKEITENYAGAFASSFDVEHANLIVTLDGVTLFEAEIYN